MVEGVPRERAKRFDFPGSRQPAPHRRSTVPPPVLHAPRRMHGKQQEWLQHPHHHVIARIQPLHPFIQPRDPLRWRLALGIERLAQFRQHGRLKFLPLQQHQHLGEQPQFVRRFLHGPHHGGRRLAMAMQKEPVDQDHHKRHVARQRIQPRRETHDVRDGNQPREQRHRPHYAERRQEPHGGAQPGVMHGCRRFAPGCQRDGIHAGARLFARDRQVLAQIQARPQLVHRALPCARRFGRGGRQQPARQRIFADVRPRGAQQFEQRAFAEQVQIHRIRMLGGEVTVACLARAGPLFVQPRQCPFEKTRRPPTPLQLLQKPVVDDHEGRKYGHRKQRPGDRQRMLDQRQPYYGRRARHRRQPAVPQ